MIMPVWLGGIPEDYILGAALGIRGFGPLSVLQYSHTPSLEALRC